MDLERLKKFLLIAFSSEQPGEAHTAMRMAVKELAKGKHDIHWLAERVDSGPRSFFDQGDSIALRQARAEIGTLRQALELLRVQNGLLEGQLRRAQRAKPAAPEPDPFDEIVRESRQRGRAREGAGWFDENAARASKPASDPGSEADWQEQLAFCAHVDNLPRLHDREREFIKSLNVQSRFGNWTPSFKQLSWLEDIFHRLRRVRAAGM